MEYATRNGFGNCQYYVDDGYSGTNSDRPAFQELLDDIREEADDKVYLLVAHNGISRVIQSYFYDMTNEEFAAFGIKNCELRKFEFPE